MPSFTKTPRQEKRTSQCFGGPAGPGLCLQWNMVDGWQAGSQQMTPHYTCKSKYEVHECPWHQGCSRCPQQLPSPVTQSASSSFLCWAGRMRRKLLDKPKPPWQRWGQSGKSPLLCAPLVIHPGLSRRCLGPITPIAGTAASYWLFPRCP